MSSDYKEYHRFHLQRYVTGCKIDCPSCGHHKCFTRYVDEEGEIEFPEQVGRCDHINSCGYNYPPRQYFADNPEVLKDIKNHMISPSFNRPIQRVVIPERPASHIDINIFKGSLKRYDINPLYKYISGMFGDKETSRLFSLYYIGTAMKWNGSTVFWQIDVKGYVRAGKIMRYDEQSGHRIKDGSPAVTWVHSELKLKDFNLIQCFFGEHLLRVNPRAHVMIVESEKTALICNHFLPEYVWLATGGMNGCLNGNAAKVLKGRDVTLYPDLGAFDKWSDKMQVLKSICSTVQISALLEENATKDQHDSGLDIADFFLRKSALQERFERLLKTDKRFRFLVERLDLELIPT